MNPPNNPPKTKGKTIRRKSRISLDPNLPPEVSQVTPRVASQKQRGRLGGLVTAARYGKELFERRSMKGGNSTLARYGSEYFRSINRYVQAKKKAEEQANKAV